MDNKKPNDSIEGLYYDYWKIHDQMMASHSPLEVAAVLMTQSLSIYKTVLSDSEYEQMVDSISEMRSKVKELSGSNGYTH